MEHHEVTGQRLMAEADSMANSTQVSMYILIRACLQTHMKILGTASK